MAFNIDGYVLIKRPIGVGLDQNFLINKRVTCDNILGGPLRYCMFLNQNVCIFIYNSGQGWFMDLMNLTSLSTQKGHIRQSLKHVESSLKKVTLNQFPIDLTLSCRGIVGLLVFWITGIVKPPENMILWNLSVTATSIIKSTTCDLFSNVF